VNAASSVGEKALANRDEVEAATSVAEVEAVTWS
jgi:hypothetical protein